MGLDNGIIIKYTNNTIEKELGYWRRCWNIRRTMLEILNLDLNSSGEHELTLDNLVEFYYCLCDFNRRNWTEKGSCIWLYRDFKQELREQKKDIKKFIKEWKKNPEKIDKVVFYDSY